VLCRFGYMLMADRAAALRGTHRVLKPEGRLALAVWDTPDRNMWLAVPAMQLIARGALQMPEPGTPTPFALANPGELEQLLRDAGFSEVTIEKVEFSQTYDSFEHFWDITLDLGAPIAAALAEIDADVRDSVRAAARDVLSQFTSADGVITVPASAVVARAVA
jgi:SAM-dependent methyltransferase